MSCCPHSAPAFCGEWGFQPRWLPLNKNKTKQQNTTISTVVLGGKYRRSLDPRLVRTNDWEHHGQHYGYSVTVEVCLVCSMTCGQPLDNSPWCGDVMWRCKNGCYSSEINRPQPWLWTQDGTLPWCWFTEATAAGSPWVRETLETLVVLWWTVSTHICGWKWWTTHTLKPGIKEQLKKRTEAVKAATAAPDFKLWLGGHSCTTLFFSNFSAN